MTASSRSEAGAEDGDRDQVHAERGAGERLQRRLDLGGHDGQVPRRLDHEDRAQPPRQRPELGRAGSLVAQPREQVGGERMIHDGQRHRRILA